MKKEEALIKIYQINALTAELTEYIKDTMQKPSKEIKIIKESIVGGKWIGLGNSIFIWNSDFDVYEYNMTGQVRRDGKILSIPNRQFTISLKGKRIFMYMPSRRSIVVYNAAHPTIDKPMVFTDINEACANTGISKYRALKVLDREMIIHTGKEEGLIFRTGYPQPYVMGNRIRKDQG